MKRSRQSKRSISIFILVMATCSILLGGMSANAEGGKPYWADDTLSWPRYVSVKTLKVYDGKLFAWDADLTRLSPTDSQVIRTLNQGDIVNAVRWGDDIKWVAVRLEDGTLGMVDKSGISEPWVGFVSSSSLTVRSGASGNAAVIKKLAKDEMVEVMSVKGAWAKVRYWGNQTYTGWVAQAYITQTVPDSSERKMAQEMLKLINAERIKAELNTLNEDKELLSKGAAIRVRELEDYFGHTRPDGSSYSSILIELHQDRIPAVSENAHYNFDKENPIKTAMKSFMESSGHRANILNPDWKYVGIGIYQDKGLDYCRTYVIQMFSE